MSKLEIGTEQTTITIADEEYLVTAMPASIGLAWMDLNQESLDSGKSDHKLMKEVICTWVSKDNKSIDPKRFDTIFSRKYVTMRKLYQAVLDYNFAELFQEPDSNDQ